MDPDVRQVSVFCALEDLGEVDWQLLRRDLRRRRHVVVIVVAAGKRILEDDVSGDFFDLVEAAFDRIPERALGRFERRRRHVRRLSVAPLFVVADVRTLVASSKDGPENCGKCSEAEGLNPWKVHLKKVSCISFKARSCSLRKLTRI